MEKSKDGLKINIIFNIIYQIITVLSPLIVTPRLSRVFGLDYIGIKSYTFSIVYYFAIFGVLGLDMLGQRRVALVKDDTRVRSKEFWTIYTTRFLLVFFCSVIYVIYAFVIDTSTVEKVVTFCWLIYLIREMINPIWFLQGMEKFKLLSIWGIISQICYIICTIFFVNAKNDLPLYIVFYTAIPLLVSICYFPTVRKYVVWVKPRIKDMILSLKESIVYFVPTIATAIYSMVDKTMLGIFDPQKVSTGLYESSERLVKVALALSTATFTIMRTRMSYLYGKKDTEAYSKMSSIFMSFSLMLCWPIMFGIIGISRDFVPVFFGPGFENVVNLSYVFSLVIPCLTVSGLLQAIFIFPHGLQKTMDIYYGVIVFINVIMNLILIKMFGTIGAIFSSVFSELLLAIILIIRARKDIDVVFLFKGSIKYFMSSLVMLAAIMIISYSLSTDIIIKLIVEFVCAVLVYFLMCIVLRDKFVVVQSKVLVKKAQKVLSTRKG